jgi:hypothetical protein
MFLIFWNVLGCILLISTLFILISLMRESKHEEVQLPFASRKSSHEERRYS